MKYVLTGSLGHISKPLAAQLISAGHNVNIISSKTSNEEQIRKIGGIPLTGSVEDQNFLVSAFKGADAVYLMIPPKFDFAGDWISFQKKIVDNYIEAVKQNSIKHVVVLSSIGAHLGNGAGPIDGLAYLESQINELTDVNAAYLRPSYFYYNLLSMIPMIKNAGIMGGNQPANYKLALVHPEDIALVAAEKLLSDNLRGKEITYIAGDDRSWKEITHVLAKSIGKENIPWIEFTDEQSVEGMLQAGLPETIAKGYTTMGIAFRTGIAEEDFRNNHYALSGKIKLEDFSREFVKAYNN